MKKIALIAALLASASVYAQGPTSLTGGLVKMADCQYLNEDVTVPLSTNVKGAYSCPDSAVHISVATCHTGGRVSSRTIRTVCNDASLTSADAAYVPNAPVCPTGQTFIEQTSSGAAFYHALTTGGQLLAQPLDGKLCDLAGANVKTKVTQQ